MMQIISLTEFLSSSSYWVVYYFLLSQFIDKISPHNCFINFIEIKFVHNKIIQIYLYSLMRFEKCVWLFPAQ